MDKQKNVDYSPNPSLAKQEDLKSHFLCGFHRFILRQHGDNFIGQWNNDQGEQCCFQGSSQILTFSIDLKSFFPTKGSTTLSHYGHVDGRHCMNIDPEYQLYTYFTFLSS